MGAPLCAALGVGFHSGAALAEPRSEADRLFELGVQGLQAGDFNAACPALSESYRLDPLLGTLFTLAECERLAHLPATALVHYEAFLAATQALPVAQRRKHKDRESVALQQRDVMAVLAPRLVLKLALAAPDPSRSPRVDLDGFEVPRAALGTSIRVNPGNHSLTVSTPDGVERRAVSLVEREEKVVELALPAARPLAPLALALAPPPPPPPRIPVAAYVSGGVGVAGLVVGAVGGLLALSKKSEVNAGCDANKQCTLAGKQAADALQTDAVVSTVGFAVGAAGVGTTVVLLLLRRTTPPPEPVAARVVPLFSITGPRDAWIGIERSF